MKLEDLGWVLNRKITDYNYYYYTRGDDVLIIDLEERKILLNNNELSFASLKAIMDVAVNYAIY